MSTEKELQENVVRINTLLKAGKVVEILKVNRTMAYNLTLRGKTQQSGLGNAGVSGRRTLSSI